MDKIIIVLVGLPARGKSYTSNNLCRFLNWCGLLTKVFNCGDYRRKLLGGFQDANFFDFTNKENFDKKEEVSKLCFKDLLFWLETEGDIAIFDATNSNELRRKYLIDNAKSYKDRILFIELISNDEVIIKNNLNLKFKSPDYLNRDKEFAFNDFNKRLQFYNESYETINDNENLRYIKIINFTEKLLINNVIGVNESLIMSYLMNLRLNKHPIYITRHGQSENNVKRIIGGDADITEEGKFYAVKLHEYINKEIEDEFIIFTSCLKRTKQTAKHFTQKKIESRLLNEIHGGICENLSYDEIEDKYPNITIDRKKDKLRFRYPQGESYLDLFERLRYFVLQLTSYNKPILIVAHNAIIKVLLGYFEEKKHEDIPHSDIDLNTVIKLIPNSKNYDIEYKNLVNDVKN